MRHRGYIIIIVCLYISINYSKAQVFETDSLVLVEIYNDFNGDLWSDNTGWLSDPVQDWFGVVLDQGRVVALKLSNNNLAGTIPASMGQLSELSEIEMALNDIHGEIPVELANLSKLERLILSKNQLAGQVPEVIALLSNLKELNLLSNDLVGPLPDLSSLQNLERLYLDQNKFSGPFPGWILDLSSLNTLGMRQVGLTGELPDNLLDALGKLEYLRLASNDLTGDISKWLKDSTAITSIDIFGNNFTGSIPDSVFSSTLNSFSIANNDIIGLPDFSSVEMPMAYVAVEQNRLSFDELKKLDSVTTFNPDRLIKGPQLSLLDPDTIVAVPGDQITIASGSYDENDIYQWYKDGAELIGEMGQELILNSFVEGDQGEYTCIITNPGFEFELERSPVFIQADDVNSTRSSLGLNIKVWPNPTSGRISISGRGIEEVHVLDAHGHVLISSRLRELDISQIPSGRYVLRITAENGQVTTTGIVKL